MGGGVGANLRRPGEEALQRHSGRRPAARGPASSSGVAGGAEPARQLRRRGRGRGARPAAPRGRRRGTRPAAPASRGPPSSFGVGGVGVEGGRAQWREAGVAGCAGPERRGARTTDLAWPVAAAAPGTSGGGGGGERDLRLRKAACGGELLCVLRVCVA